MLDKAELTERQKRELEYYEEYAEQKFAFEEVDFDLVKGEETRPWNPYWFTYQYVLERVTHKDPTLLDFGCGAGEMSVLFASRGFHTSGFDISPANVMLSEKNAEHHGVSELTTFSTHTAEHLPYPDNYFDVVAGLDILHHVDIPVSMKECYRVLKPGGFAIFREPVEAFLFDWVRNWPLTLYFFPGSKSIERHVTEDERKLNKTDRRILAEIFDKVDEFPFSVFARFHKLLPVKHSMMALEKVDSTAVKVLPPLRTFAGCIVFVMHKAS